MTNTRKKVAAKRAAVRTSSYYNYGVVKETSQTKGNLANFLAGVFLTVAIYALARFFGI